MGRIGASLNGIERLLLNRLNEANTAIERSAIRQASGQRITRAVDDPSGFFSLSRHQSELTKLNASLTNVTAASELVSGAQLALDQIRTQLNTIRTKALEDEDQTLTDSGRAANQAEIDNAIAAISELVNTDFSGQRLLDGSANFNFSGIDSAQISALDVFALGPNATATISGQVDSAATQASITITGSSGQTTGDATFTLAGDRGEASISITNGEDLADVATRINLESHLTGVTAEASGDTLTLTSIDFGTDAAIAINDQDVTSGTLVLSASSATGTDATAEINGQSLTGDGNRFTVYDNGLRFQVEFDSSFTGTFDDVTVSGDALSFALSSNPAEQSTVAIRGLQPARLGGLSGTLDSLLTGGDNAGLDTNAPTAVRIVDEALAILDLVEGNVDGFANAVISSASSLTSGLKSELEDTIEAINGVDDNEESLLQAKNQQLAANALAGLSILDEQRQGVLAILNNIAGLPS